MEIKRFVQILNDNLIKKDSLDIPDCFGEFNKKDRLCSKYCSISIRCCIIHNQSPKIDILEKLLIQNRYAIKLQ